MSLDREDLRSLIQKLRTKRAEKKEEKNGLVELIASQEQLLAKLRQEATVLLPNDDLRWEAGNETTDSSQLLGVEGNKRYQMLNDKLEMQILIAEIRQSLPGWERDVHLYESRVENEKRKLQRHAKAVNVRAKRDLDEDQTNLPSLLRDISSLELETQAMTEDIREISLDCTLKHDEERTENERLVKEVAALRREIHLLADERHALKTFCIDLDSQLMLDERRAELLNLEFIQARANLEALRSDMGWFSIAFERETGSLSNRISFERAAKVLSFWLLNLQSNSSPILTLDKKFVLPEMDILAGRNNVKMSETHQQLLTGEDDEEEFLVMDSTRSKQDLLTASASNDLDFSSFCLLAKHLVNKFEIK